MDHKDLLVKYNQIIASEEKVLPGYKAPPCTPYVLGIVEQLECIADSSMTLRCIDTRYGTMQPGQLAYESVSAHTNLVKAIVDRILAHLFYSEHSKTKKDKTEDDKTEDGFTYREIMTVIERHDLAENIFGDIADNGNRPDKELSRIENSYLYHYASVSPLFDTEFEKHVKDLYENYVYKIGPTGQLIYGADKLAAILMALRYDAAGVPHTMRNDRQDASALERAAMEHCQYREYHVGGPTGDYYLCRASEMWTYSGFEFQEIFRYDKTGLLMAILVMETLIVHEKWYDWREANYPSAESV